MYEIVQSEEQGFSVYGIEGHGERIEGISSDKKALEELIALCNRENLVPWQLQDVAEDFVQQQAMQA